jgi:hypothetical protein
MGKPDLEVKTSLEVMNELEYALIILQDSNYSSRRWVSKDSLIQRYIRLYELTGNKTYQYLIRELDGGYDNGRKE